MAKLYLWVAICFEISFYSWIYASYKGYDGSVLVIIALIFLISLFFKAFPSGIYLRGFSVNYQLIEILGYIKACQLFIFFVLMPLVEVNGFYMLLIILIVISIVNWIFQSRMYKQIKTNVSIVEIKYKMNNQAKREIETDTLVGKAWKTILPLFLWAFFYETNILIKISIWIVIILLELRLINDLYSSFKKEFDDVLSKRDFFKTFVRVIIAFAILIYISFSNPANLFSFFVIGFIPSQFVNLIYRYTLKNE